MITIISFIAGFLLATVLFWYINHKQRQAWQSEYRRLMGGIKKAKTDVLNINVTRAVISNRLSKIYFNEPNWPRS
jgi:hypothetical protein